MAVYSVPFFMGQRLVGLDPPTPHNRIDPSLPSGSPQARMAVLYEHLAAAVAGDEAPTVWAGDCVSILGTISGLQRRGADPTLVFFDAHGDFNTWETTPSGFIGGMPLAMAVGRGDQTITMGAGVVPLDEERVFLVDGRDLDPGEEEALAASNVTVLAVEDVTSWEPPPGPLYVHVDVDVVDPSQMPAMNYPAPGGPSLESVESALRALSNRKSLVAASLSLWNPSLPGAPEAAAACHRLAAALTFA